MKKLIALLLCAATLLGLAACGGETKPAEPETYVGSADVEVAVAYVNDTARVVTRKLSDKEMTSIELACIYYDLQGQKIRDERIKCDFSQDTKLNLWNFAVPVGCAYMDATIAKVEYADLTTYVCPGVSTWIETSAAAFTADTYRDRVADLKKNEATAAENVSELEMVFAEVVQGTVGVQLSNKSGKDISSVVLYMLWYDANGKPVDRGGVFVPNAGRTSADNLKADETSTYSVKAPEGAVKVKGIVQTLNYADNTNWENRYIYEWAVANYTSFE